MATTALTGTIGGTILVKSAQIDAYGGSSNSPVSWSSSNSTVATVQKIYNNNNAVIVCFTAGTVTITATMGAKTAAFTLTVVSGAANDGYTLAVEADQSFQPVNKTIQTKTT